MKHDCGKVIRTYLHPLPSSTSNRRRLFPLLNLFRRPTIEEPLRHKNQCVERTDRDRETHRSTKDDNVIRARPLVRLLMISVGEILRQVFELRGARDEPPVHLSARVTEKEDDMIHASEGMSCGGVEEEEETPKSRVIPLICVWLGGFRAIRGRTQ